MALALSTRVVPIALPRLKVWPLVVGATCLAGALAASWPLALHLTTSVSLGTEQEATVPLFNLWTLWWTAHGAALLGAAMATMLPFIAKLHGVLPLLAQFGWLWSLEGLVRFREARSWRWASYAVAGFVLNFLICQQCALLVAPFVGAAGLVA